MSLTDLTKLRRSPLLFAGVIAILMISIGLNVYLSRLSLVLYRDQMAVRLDPTDSGRFGPIPAHKGNKPRILYLGDSRIALWPTPPAPEGFEAVNRGVGGETTEQIRLRLNRELFETTPKVVVLQLGVNDLRSLALFPGRETQIIARCRNNIREIVTRLKDRHFKVVLLTIFPVGRTDIVRYPIWSDRSIDAVDDVNTTLQSLAGPDVVVVDSDKVLRKGRRIDPAYALDWLHLTSAGYKALGAALEPVFMKLVDEPKRK